MKVKAIYDNEDFLDRYTVVLEEQEQGLHVCLALSDNPSSLNGVSQFNACKIGDHLGHRIDLMEMPVKVVSHVLERLG